LLTHHFPHSRRVLLDARVETAGALYFPGKAAEHCSQKKLANQMRRSLLIPALPRILSKAPRLPFFGMTASFGPFSGPLLAYFRNRCTLKDLKSRSGCPKCLASDSTDFNIATPNGLGCSERYIQYKVFKGK
tara:strand:- start:37 stop:432 length:396 start_codon:yes stop_codon:yes gene_type:complete